MMFSADVDGDGSIVLLISVSVEAVLTIYTTAENNIKNTPTSTIIDTFGKNCPKILNRKMLKNLTCNSSDLKKSIYSWSQDY